MDKTHVPYPGCYCADCVEGTPPTQGTNPMTTVSQEAREARIEHLRAEIRRCDLAIEQGTADNWWHIDRDRFRQELDDLTEPRHRQSAERETLARMVWRDIESAPKDGSWFTAYWPVQTFEDRVQTTRWLHDDCRFVDASDFMDHIQPIAWMPLPPAPEAGQ